MLEPYLYFNGQCAEALAFYTEALGATVEFQMRYGDSPEPIPGKPDGWDDKLMHASFQVAGQRVMAADAANASAFGGFALSVSLDDEADVRRTFEALSEGAEIIMPVGATFWSKAFGMLKDRFGVSWMVTLVQAE